MGRVSLWWRRSEGWALVLVAAGLGGGVGAVSAAWLHWPLAVVAGGVATSLVGVVGARGRTILDKRALRRQELPTQVLGARESGRLERVREMDDPVALGVHPAAVLERLVGGASALDRVPPYVPRDVQEQLCAAVARGGFVLLTGDSTAGKTRAAYEAIRALTPDHVLIAPTGREAAAAVLPAVLEQRRCVVWLDDLERFLGPQGLTANTVGRMLGDGNRQVLVMATMRSAEANRYSLRQLSAVDGAERELWRTGREVIELATTVEIERRWSPAEVDRAGGFADDPRIRAALGQAAQFGLSEVLAAGPELEQDWRRAWGRGGQPRGASLVAAAVDCRRAGTHVPLPLDLLAELAEHYLTHHGGPLLRPESLDDALSWATQPIHGASSLLLPSDRDGHYLAFDYLIDLPGLAAVPQATWDMLIQWATPEQAFDIGNAAAQRFQFSTAVHAYRKSAAGFVAAADIAMARYVAASGNPAEAKRMLVDMLDSRMDTVGAEHPDTLRIRHYLAVATTKTGDLAEAVSMFEGLAADQRRVLGPDHPHTLKTRYELANLAGWLFDAPQAVRLSTELVADQQRVLGLDHPDTLMTRHIAAFWTSQAGHTQRAIEMLTELLADSERVLGIDHPETVVARALVARLTGEMGNFAHAVDLVGRVVRDRERTLGPTHHLTLATRYSLVYFMAKAGDRARATTLLVQLFADWQSVLGQYKLGGFISHDGNLATVDQPVSRTAAGRRRLSEFLWTCQDLLGPDHMLTKQTEQLLAHQPAPGEEAG